MFYDNYKKHLEQNCNNLHILFVFIKKKLIFIISGIICSSITFIDTTHIRKESV